MIRRIAVQVFLFWFSCFCVNTELIAQSGVEVIPTLDYKISPFKDFKDAAVTITIDDGQLPQFLGPMEAMDARNIKATYYIISRKMFSDVPSLVRKAFAHGHEVGSHTKNHPSLSKVNYDTQLDEIINSKVDINKHLYSNQCYTFCYPYGKYDSKSVEIARDNYIAARTCNFGFADPNNHDLMLLPGIGFNTDVNYLTKANQIADHAMTNKLWLIEIYHGFDGQGYLPLPTSEFSKHLDYLINKNNNFWIAPLIDIAKYWKEMDNFQFNLVSQSKYSYSFTIDDGLSDLVFNCPLSMTFTLPYRISDTTKVRLFHNNKDSIEIHVRNLEESSEIRCSLLPDNSSYTLLISSNVNIVNNKFKVLEYYPNPIKDKVFLLVNSFEDAEINFVLIDMKGIISSNIMVRCQKGINEIQIPTENLRAGVYYLKLITGNQVSQIPLIKL